MYFDNQFDLDELVGEFIKLIYDCYQFVCMAWQRMRVVDNLGIEYNTPDVHAQEL